MPASSNPTRWPHTTRHQRHDPSTAAGHHDGHPPAKPVTEGYWVEWTPETPQPNTGYDAELHLPAGAYLLTATANVRLADTATGTSDVECSLFVGQQNVSLHQVRVAPGSATNLAATAHAQLSAATVIQWVCGSTTGPWLVDLAVTAVKVDVLHYIG